ncbi:DUF4178 domain-containing protein [Thiolinea disciformis]|uniref:DUF4178 domain-containing protein n=1 Tax=Thiolinea disciformis TaxID=125614 RepID=UPI00035E058B|nr:DUF4178 domain-containing protein [Thiolinea disciformis]
MKPKTHNCPQCGNLLPVHFRFSKLTVCAHCGSTIFLEDEAVRLAGKASVLADMPSLLQLRTPFTYQKLTYTPVGQVRYTYKGGFWDEWWVIDSTGMGRWLSVDEGDFAFESPMEWIDPFPNLREVQVGQTIKQRQQEWEITEKNIARCEGIKGELPEAIFPDDKMIYLHLSGNNSALVTLEYPMEGKPSAYQGSWIDPFEIKAAL